MYVISDTARYIRKTSIAPPAVYPYDIGRVKWYANVDLSMVFLFAYSKQHTASLSLVRFKLSAIQEEDRSAAAVTWGT